MFKRTLSALAVGAALVAASMSPAQALEITAGNYKIIFDNWDVGTVGYGDTSGVKCTTVAECNAVPGLIDARGTTSDSAGILSVASIQNLSNASIEYTRGTASTLNGLAVGPYLTGVFSGLDDYFVEVLAGVTGANTTALATGGTFSIFSNASNWNPGLGPVGLGVDLDALQYPSISGGSLFLSGNFATGAVLTGNNTASYITTYNNGTIGGNGRAFLDFTGGSALDSFDTNGTANVNGGVNDASLSVTFDRPDLINVANPGNWDVISSGQILGNVQNVPEPGSLALMSLALLGLGAMTKRQRNKKN